MIKKYSLGKLNDCVKWINTVLRYFGFSILQNLL